MPRNTDLRTRTGVDKGRMPTSARRTVQYRGVDGITQDALVLAQGSSSGLKLKVPNLRAGAGGAGSNIIDNVALGTSIKQTNVYFWAKPA